MTEKILLEALILSLSSTKVVACTCISTDAQDLDKQKHLLLAYAGQQKLIDEFIEVTISSRESPREHKIDVLLDKLQAGDTLLMRDLSRLGRNMLETLGIINTFSEQGIKVAQRLFRRKRFRFTDEQPSRLASQPRKIRSGQQGIIHG